jgi:phosphinothricin acetyltransferase
MRIRKADPETDAGACAAIYAPFVQETLISFEYDPPTSDEFRRRIKASLGWLVAEAGNEVVGFAYLSSHRDRSAYRWAADSAVYVARGRQRSGAGRLLYARLFEDARAIGLRMLCAGVTQPNEASNGFHEAMGFQVVGTYRKIGWKFDAWHDVRWYQLDLSPTDDGPPATLRSS